MTRTGPRNVGAYLPSETFKQISGHLDNASNLFARWRAAVSEPLVSHSYPVSYNEGHLSVRADSSAWANRLRQSQQEIMTGLRRDPFFTQLSEIQIRVLPSHGDISQQNEKNKSDKPSRIPENAARLIKSVADDITDPVLRKALARLADMQSMTAGHKK